METEMREIVYNEGDWLDQDKLDNEYQQRIVAFTCETKTGKLITLKNKVYSTFKTEPIL